MSSILLAFHKSLGTGFAEGVSWRDIEVVRQESGAPALRLHGGTEALAKAKGISQMLVSLTHLHDTAAAQVVLCG